PGPRPDLHRPPRRRPRAGPSHRRPPRPRPARASRLRPGDAHRRPSPGRARRPRRLHPGRAPRGRLHHRRPPPPPSRSGPPAPPPSGRAVPSRPAASLVMTPGLERGLLGADERGRLEAVADLTATGATATITADHADADVLVTGWGAPVLDAATLDLLPRLAL